MVQLFIKSLFWNLIVMILCNYCGIYDEGYVFCVIYFYLLNR